MKPHAYLGLLILTVAEILLFKGNHFVGYFFTPIVWTGYVLLVDGLLFTLTRQSLFSTFRVELIMMVVVSVGVWWVFELYNAPRFWQSNEGIWWHYHNLPRNPYVRRVGYDWAFATILPGMFLTARLLLCVPFISQVVSRPLKFSSSILYSISLLGAIAAALPLLFPRDFFVPAVWLSFIFLLDPINYFRGWPSVAGDVAAGTYGRILALLGSGAICGLLWEFWNYWAVSKWTYTVPFVGNLKLFEMPVLGFLGFPPFAVECWVMYVFCRSLLSKTPLALSTQSIWIEKE